MTTAKPATDDTEPARIFLDSNAVTEAAKALAHDANARWDAQDVRHRYTAVVHLALTSYLRNTTPPGVFTTSADDTATG